MVKKKVTTCLEASLHKEALLNDIVFAEALKTGVEFLLGRADSDRRELERLEKKRCELESKISFIDRSIEQKKAELSKSKEQKKKLEKLKEEKVRIVRMALNDKTLSKLSDKNVHWCELVKKGWKGTFEEFTEQVFKQNGE